MLEADEGWIMVTTTRNSRRDAELAAVREQGRTTVLTSHRPSLILQSDLVYVIEHGRVTERGTSQALAESGGWLTRFLRSAEGSWSETTAGE